MATTYRVELYNLFEPGRYMQNGYLVARSTGATVARFKGDKTAAHAYCYALNQHGEPRRSPTPCCDGCKGWEVFEVNRCTVHGDDCELATDDCSRLEIEACDACWFDDPDAPGDDYYQAHPVCQVALDAARGAE